MCRWDISGNGEASGSASKLHRILIQAAESVALKRSHPSRPPSPFKALPQNYANNIDQWPAGEQSVRLFNDGGEVPKAPLDGRIVSTPGSRVDASHSRGRQSDVDHSISQHHARPMSQGDAHRYHTSPPGSEYSQRPGTSRMYDTPAYGGHVDFNQREAFHNSSNHAGTQDRYAGGDGFPQTKDDEIAALLETIPGFVRVAVANLDTGATLRCTMRAILTFEHFGLADRDLRLEERGSGAIVNT